MWTIPDSVTNIRDKAFTNCSSITRVNIPDSLIPIINNQIISLGTAFVGCSSLINIEVGSGNTKFSSEKGVLFTKTKLY